MIAIYPKAYIDYLVYYHAERDYFECHEVMEEYWKTQIGQPFEKAWLALIQIAVAQYHERRGNITGAIKMLNKVLENPNADEFTQLGLKGEALIAKLDHRRHQLSHHSIAKISDIQSFIDLDLPLADPGLLQRCLAEIKHRQLTWCATSDMTNERLIHKHRLRDRTDVIFARQQSLQHKSKNRKDAYND